MQTVITVCAAFNMSISGSWYKGHGIRVGIAVLRSRAKKPPVLPALWLSRNQKQNCVRKYMHVIVPTPAIVGRIRFQA